MDSDTLPQQPPGMYKNMWKNPVNNGDKLP